MYKFSFQKCVPKNLASAVLCWLESIQGALKRHPVRCAVRILHRLSSVDTHWVYIISNVNVLTWCCHIGIKKTNGELLAPIQKKGRVIAFDTWCRAIPSCWNAVSSAPLTHGTRCAGQPTPSGRVMRASLPLQLNHQCHLVMRTSTHNTLPAGAEQALYRRGNCRIMQIGWMHSDAVGAHEWPIMPKSRVYQTE